MQERMPAWKWASCAALLVGGCGAVPDFVVDAARSSAKETIEQSVHDKVADLLDFGNVLLPFGGEFDLNDFMNLEDLIPSFDEVGNNEGEPDGEEPVLGENERDEEQAGGRR